MKLVFYIVLPALAFVGLYIGNLFLGEWLEVRQAPKEDMFFCQKHGFIRRAHIITFKDYEVEVAPMKFERQDVEYCPLCYGETMHKLGGLIS